MSTPLRTATYVKVKDLAPGTHGHNLVARVLSVEIISEKVQGDGTTSRIAEVLIGDETGTVIVSAWNEQIDLFIVGRNVVVRNADVVVRRGFVRLRISKWGKLASHPDGIKSTPKAPGKVHTENNMSAIEYELVAVEDTE
ncbi:hypothetical protein SPRG_07680 [Saprolegnia parasitica CBS 223.65]|uniref:Single-stranded DNA binding protein Ssb-like OB fold domain-containing protein n=1 Tax=Saprolegnia parasitica (strain CBS 223.65) TaxID=695850 RepID=A0A067CJH5_SAPPC|nr:hypothetical protein SPRG_07680 [Saprolegnia parasitica CBS 223.65]KDO26967.1 hypothetical protein SPRG_07680 [Saprolegnia parasitica CBS 223.65]|eukprot:XP_012202348.1 hypothetical protein SPRG_07680 [Saprolegnia parasitica CBS 223.65]